MISLDQEDPTEGELREDLADFRELVESKGWQKLMQVATAQSVARGSFIYGPIKQEQVFEQEFTKGELSGIKLFMQMPHDLIENARLEIEQLIEEENDATE